MNTIIAKVLPDSIAEELEFEAGDKLISINGTEIADIIDYKFLLADECIEVEIEKADGELWAFDIEKEYQDDLGIEFENQIMDDARSCHNNCLFCFIDQLPQGMRETLYFKDDDSRLSFLQGNFVTLTNMSEEDLNRIIRYRISPINISVHTSNPELRKKMLNNRFAGNVMERLQKLADAGIQMNCQLVLCPGYNDGAELLKTAADLYQLYPEVENVAAVPVGITKYRKNAKEFVLYDAAMAKRELENVRAFQEKAVTEIGTPFIRLADEFYVMSNSEIPPTEFYGDFEQLEDGIGMIRFFRNSIAKTISKLRTDGSASFSVISGVSAYAEIEAAAAAIREKNPSITITVHKIRNDFFGPTITVAGLLTGQDVMQQLPPDDALDYIIMPKNMFKNDELVMLDDVSLQDLETYYGKKILVCDFTGEDMIHIMNNHIA